MPVLSLARRLPPPRPSQSDRLTVRRRSKQATTCASRQPLALRERHRGHGRVRLQISLEPGVRVRPPLAHGSWSKRGSPALERPPDRVLLQNRAILEIWKETRRSCLG